ncbi:MAG: hypothetical protein ACXACP_03190 [Candidatus Hodarchaeales archaeon]
METGFLLEGGGGGGGGGPPPEPGWGILRLADFVVPASTSLTCIVYVP